MKLKEWAKKQGISYITAYRWFKDGKLPIKAYQSESGTIIVQDEFENVEHPTYNILNQSNDIMSLFLKKTVEFSKNNASVEDFAAYILSNFSLKLKYLTDHPKYSKNKPKSEDIQKHFQQFLKPKGEKPKLNMLIAEGEIFDKLPEQCDSPGAQEIMRQFDKCSELVVNKIDVNSQSIPTTFLNFTDAEDKLKISSMIPNVIVSASGVVDNFKPRQKEIESVTKTMEQVVNKLQDRVIKLKKVRKTSNKK